MEIGSLCAEERLDLFHDVWAACIRLDQIDRDDQFRPHHEILEHMIAKVLQDQDLFDCAQIIYWECREMAVPQVQVLIESRLAKMIRPAPILLQMWSYRNLAIRSPISLLGITEAKLIQYRDRYLTKCSQYHNMAGEHPDRHKLEQFLSGYPAVDLEFDLEWLQTAVQVTRFKRAATSCYSA